MRGIYKIPPSMITDSDYQLILNSQLKDLVKSIPVLSKSKLVVSAEDCVLSVIVQKEFILNKVGQLQSKIGTLAYRKLGCKKIYFYLQNICKWDYTYNVFAAAKDTTTMITTLERTAQETNNQKSPNWISFQNLADELDVEVSQIENNIEAFNIPGIKQNGEWGLPISSVKAYLQKHFAQAQQDAIERLVPQGARGSARGGARRASKNNRTLKSTPPLPEPTNFTDSSMKLPSGYSVIPEGKNRKPATKQALIAALSTISDGQDTDKYWENMELISLSDKSSDFFVNQLAEMLKSTNKPVKVGVAEIYDSATQLIRERRRSMNAA